MNKNPITHIGQIIIHTTSNTEWTVVSFCDFVTDKGRKKPATARLQNNLGEKRVMSLSFTGHPLYPELWAAKLRNWRYKRKS